jgi:nucleotidyltransferase substrate binding protein (TIGR01987 family)
MINDYKYDVRWLQRFNNYRKALKKLGQAVDIVSEKMDWGEGVDDLLQEGLIQRFEYTHELAWKVMKDYAEYQGYTDIKGSRDAFRKGLEMGIIDSVKWMESIEDRNQTSHNYDDETANEIFEAVVNEYYPLFVKFEQEMLKISEPGLF